MGYLFLGLAFCVIAKVYAGENEDLKFCDDLFNLPENANYTCCNSFEVDFLAKGDDCLNKEEDSQCEDFECHLRENGLFKDNKIDEDGVKKYLDELERNFPSEKPALHRVRTQCLDGKYETNLPAKDVCPAIKFYFCMVYNIYLECSSWKTDESCSKVAESVKKCNSALGY